MASFINTARASASQSESTSDPTPSASSDPSPPPPPSSVPGAKLRILCLHGGCHNGSVFRSQLAPLLSHLRKAFRKRRMCAVEFVFVDGPLLNDGSLSYANMPKEGLGLGTDDPTKPLYDPAAQDTRQRMWFHEPSGATGASAAKLSGADASLLWLSQCWNVSLDSDPYHGILAFSQGAALAAMLPLIQDHHYAFKNLRFLMLVSGYIPSPPPERGFGHATKADHFRTEYVDIPSLHVVGKKNEVVVPEESNRLVQRFVDPVVFRHSHGHCLPPTPECFNVISEFLLQRGLELLGPSTASTLHMQARLRELEMESQSLINYESGCNPPRALMAVIDRSAVGGWSGGRRVEPGGGAPCPSEFTRKESERGGKEEAGKEEAGKKDKGEDWGEGEGRADRSKPPDSAAALAAGLKAAELGGKVHARTVVESQDVGDPCVAGAGEGGGGGGGVPTAR